MFSKFPPSIIVPFMRCGKKNTKFHCCVSTATIVTRTRHNVTFTSIAYLVLTQYEAVNISQRLTRDKETATFETESILCPVQIIKGIRMLSEI